jgi:hypothetical protein
MNMRPLLKLSLEYKDDKGQERRKMENASEKQGPQMEDCRIPSD